MPDMRLTKADVAVVRETINNKNAKELADKFGVSKITIRNVVLGSGIYGQIENPPPLDKWIRQVRSDGLSDSDKLKIKALVAARDKNNLTLKEIGAKFDVSESYVSRIASGDYD